MARTGISRRVLHWLAAAAAILIASHARADEFDAYRAAMLSDAGSDADWARRGAIAAHYVEGLVRLDRLYGIRTVRVRLDDRARPSPACLDGVPLAFVERAGDTVSISFCPTAMRMLRALSALQTLDSLDRPADAPGGAAPRGSFTIFMEALLARSTTIVFANGHYAAPIFCDPFPFILANRQFQPPCAPEVARARLDAALDMSARSPTILASLQFRRTRQGSAPAPRAFLAEMLDGRLQGIADFLVAHEVAHHFPRARQDEAQIDALAAELIRRDGTNNLYNGVVEPSLSIHYMSELFSEEHLAAYRQSLDARVDMAVCTGLQQLIELRRTRSADFDALLALSSSENPEERRIAAKVELLLSAFDRFCTRPRPHA